ncbi:hypothetical protein [Azospirillum sp. sgz302134]
MRHFTQAAKPALPRGAKAHFDGFSRTMYEADIGAHERSEDEFADLFLRRPDHADPLDVDTCWRLYLAELEMLATCATETGADDAEELEAMLDHYRDEHEAARRDHIPEFLAEAGLRQKDLAALLSVSEHTIVAWKKGAFSRKAASVPDWLMVWCELWLAAPAALLERMLARATAAQWEPEHRLVAQSWLGRWSEMLIALPREKQRDVLAHIRLVEG